VVCATTGEASTLSYTEHLSVVEFCCKQVNGRIPVIAGAGSNDTKHAIDLSKECFKIGADALLIVTPYYNKTSQEGLVRHYFEIATATDAPIMLYNVPSRTGLNILPETYKKLSQHENIVAVKEANGDISSVAKTASLCKEDLWIYSGNDDQILPILSLGGQGVVSVASNIVPHIIANICRSFFEFDLETCKDLQLEYHQLVEAVFCDVNPMPIKYALNLMDFNVGQCRLPLTTLPDKKKNFIIGTLKKYHLIEDDTV
jgi:4-hydroxy-tetrahydrodipicolinate synthase